MRKGRREATEKTAGETGDTAESKKRKKEKTPTTSASKAPRRPFRPRALREKKIFFFLPVLDSAHSLFSLSSSLFSSSLFSFPLSLHPPQPINQVAARAEEAPVATGKISGKKYSQAGGRWAAIDATNDLSDDQQDITRAKGMVDELYQGWAGQGTQDAVMSSEEYLSNASRSMNNIEDGYYISPAFLDKMSIHVAKNFLDLPKIKVPLILGIWGGKGQGKTFQCALAYKKLGISPIVMSAGELESGNAGEPAKLIRQRYREASDIIRKGKMCSLFINDLDAGAGRMGGGTQYTVNNQMVNATLMNIADNPTNVQLPGVYKTEEIPRVPVVCTGNDFSTLYAPLIRDGRMEKFYWAPPARTASASAWASSSTTASSARRGRDDCRRVPRPVDRLLRRAPRPRLRRRRARVRGSIGIENIGKRLINSPRARSSSTSPPCRSTRCSSTATPSSRSRRTSSACSSPTRIPVGAELAGAGGTSMPEAVKAK